MKKVYLFRPHPAFTLLELVISFGVMSIVIFGAASLYVTSIRANAAQIERFIAYNLAQEGLEGVRNIRDSYYREGLAWDGSDTTSAKNVKLVDAPFSSGNFRIYRKVSVDFPHTLAGTENTSSVAFSASPWVFTTCTATTVDCGRLYLTKDGDAYIHRDEKIPFDAVASPYSRKISISFLDDKGAEVPTSVNARVMRVTSTVTWLDHGNAKSLDLVTELTDWKQQPF